MNSKERIHLILFATLLLISTGCYVLGIQPKYTVKTVSDLIEAVPLGTSYDKMFNSSELTKLRAGELLTARFDPYNFLPLNPCLRDLKSICLYRQWPSGILLDIDADDLCCEVGVSENIDETGSVYVFFDKKRGFKGYYANSFVKYSDDGARLQSEKQTFRDLGLEEISVRAEGWSKTLALAGRPTNNLPGLPLRNSILGLRDK